MSTKRPVTLVIVLAGRGIEGEPQANVEVTVRKDRGPDITKMTDNHGRVEMPLEPWHMYPITVHNVTYHTLVQDGETQVRICHGARA